MSAMTPGVKREGVAHLKTQFGLQNDGRVRFTGADRKTVRS